MVGLREGVVVGDSVTVVAEPTKVRLRALLFLHGYGHNFDLVVSEADFYFKFWRHLELISFN